MGAERVQSSEPARVAALATDCAQIGLDYPADLISGIELERPGESLAAIYCWQAARAFMALDARTRSIAGDCLASAYGDEVQVGQTILTELDGGLALLSSHQGARIAASQQPSLIRGLLRYSLQAGEFLRDVVDHRRKISPLRAVGDPLRPIERFELMTRDVDTPRQREIGEVVHWLQMAAWAMACAMGDGRRYLAVISAETMAERPAPETDVDRLLLRLGANLMPLRSESELVDRLPAKWYELFWPHDLFHLAADLDERDLLARKPPRGTQIWTKDLELDLGEYRFHLGRLRKVRDLFCQADPDLRQHCRVLIWTPWGMTIGLVHLKWSEEGDETRLALHVPVLESRPGFATDLMAIRAIQNLQAWLVTAIYQAEFS